MSIPPPGSGALGPHHGGEGPAEPSAGRPGAAHRDLAVSLHWRIQCGRDDRLPPPIEWWKNSTGTATRPWWGPPGPRGPRGAGRGRDKEPRRRTQAGIRRRSHRSPTSADEDDDREKRGSAPSIPDGLTGPPLFSLENSPLDPSRS
ncbi:hypothetical protein KM043_008569 [Ampulex compressa]|nr:hypothetical protein KM043_008569 [Ampulex compressa]